MIEWTDELLAQIGSYSRAVLSYPGQDGYPVTLPLPFTFDRGEHHFTFPMPSQPLVISLDGEDYTSLTLLHYDPQTASERYLLFYGQLTEHGTAWSFTPSRVVFPQWRRRRNV
jgi:hypothetical protein